MNSGSMNEVAEYYKECMHYVVNISGKGQEMSYMFIVMQVKMSIDD